MTISYPTREQLIKALDERQRDEADDQEFDTMLRARRALRNWDGTPPVPYSEDLRRWGLLSVDPVGTDFSSADPVVETTVGDLATPLEDAVARDEVNTVPQEESSANNASELAGEDQPVITETTADIDELNRSDNIEATETQIETALADVDLGVAGDLTAPPLDAVQSELNTPLEENTPTIAIEEQSVPDLDDELRPDLDIARQVLQKGEWYDAVNRLRDLNARARASLKIEIQTLLDQALTRLMEETNGRIKTAQNYEQDYKNDLDGRFQAWQRVLDINPQSPEALAGQAEVEKLREYQRLQSEFQAVKADAETAITERDAVKVDQLKATLADVLSHISEAAQKLGAPELMALQQQIEEYVNKEYANKREKLRQELGYASTLALQGDLLPAYREIKKAVEAGIPNLLVGKEGSTVSPREYLERIAQTLIAQIKDHLNKYLGQAEAAETPIDADAFLQQAQELVEKAGLTTDHRASLVDTLNIIKDKRDDLARQIELYNQARQWVTEYETSAGLSPRERLKLLIEARDQYPRYPRIDQLIQIAHAHVGNELARKIRSEMNDIQALASPTRRQYDQALKQAAELQDLAHRDMVEITPGSDLAQALNLLESLIRNIYVYQSEYQHVIEQIDSANQKLDEYDRNKEQRTLLEARTIYDQLEAAYGKQYTEIGVLYARLTGLISDADKWEAGRQSYEKRDWEAAFQALSQIRTQFAEFQSASQLKNRADAARMILKGRGEQNTSRWSEAIKLYRNALAIIEAEGVDPYIQVLAEDCRAALQEISIREANNSTVQKQIDDARTLIARAQSASRHTLMEKLALVPEYSRAIEILHSAQQTESTLLQEIDRQIAETRTAWRSAYFAGIDEVLKLPEPVLEMVGRANQLTEELYQAGLLGELSDILAYWWLKALQYKLQFAEWYPQGINSISNPAIDLNAVITNRRGYQQAIRVASQYKLNLLDPSKPLDPQSPVWLTRVLEKIDSNLEKQIEQDIRRIACDRIYAEARRMQLDVANQNVTTKNATIQAYLEQQMADPTQPQVAQDQRLIEMLIQTYWELKNWPSAEAACKRFLEIRASEPDLEFANQQNLTDLWILMTSVAKAYSEDQIDQAEAYVREIEGEPYYFDHEQEIQTQLSDLRKKTFNRLIQEAEDMIRPSTSTSGSGVSEVDQRYMFAARKYALANQLEAESQVVQHGLSKLGKNLDAPLTNYCNQAESLKIAGRPLPIAIQEAEELLSNLKSIQTVAKWLQLDEEKISKLNEVIERLQPRIKVWKDFYKQQKDIESALEGAISTPVPFDYEDESIGGWNLASVRSKVDALGRGISGDTELLSSNNTTRERIGRYVEAADNLTNLARQLMNAVHDERFSEVETCAVALDAAWQAQRRKDSRWDGLEELIRERYEDFNRDAKSIRDHRDLAAQQTSNLEKWRIWAANTSKQLVEIRAYAKKINKSLDDFDDLCQDYALDELVEELKKAAQAGNKFLDQYNQRPTDLPKSDLAREEEKKIPVQSEEEVKRYLEQFARLKRVAEDRQKEFGPYLTRLKSVMMTIKNGQNQRKPIAQATWLLLEREITSCETIDPLNKEVVKARELLNRQ